jgi:hypothetical protein
VQQNIQHFLLVPSSYSKKKNLRTVSVSYLRALARETSMQHKKYALKKVSSFDPLQNKSQVPLYLFHFGQTARNLQSTSRCVVGGKGDDEAVV